MKWTDDRPSIRGYKEKLMAVRLKMSTGLQSNFDKWTEFRSERAINLLSARSRYLTTDTATRPFISSFALWCC